MTKNKKPSLVIYKSSGPAWERKFGGKIYTHYTTWSLSKSGAIDEAERHRMNGNPSRVVKLKDGYHVYIHFKKRKRMEYKEW